MRHLEADISQDITQRQGFRRLFKAYGLKSFRLSKREMGVACGGLNREFGRLDLLYESDGGKIIVEVQRGKSNNDHYERFAGYLSNFAERECLGLVWVAEEFTDMHLYMCQTSANPILPVEARWNGKRFDYRVLLPIEECFGSYAIARVNQEIYKKESPKEPARWKNQPSSLRELFNARNGELGYCLRLLAENKVWSNGMTSYEINKPASVKVNDATLRRLQIALS